MSVFLCLVRPDGSPIDDAHRRRFSTRREVPRVVPPSWCVSGEFAAMLGSDVPGLEPRVAAYGSWIGVGLVRLDRGYEPPAARPQSDGDDTDLTRVLQALDASGVAAVATLVGDFAFVAWNREARQLIAARDTFGVRRLYMARRGDVLAFCTRASLLAESDEYNLEYFAEFLLNRDDPSERTAFADVEAVRSAEVVSYTDGRLRRDRYWAPPDPDSRLGSAGDDIVEEFKQLLFDAVASRLTGTPNVWSHLSGGMDSSSVVGVSQALKAQGTVSHGVAGVVTYQSTPPLGTDVEHARLVADRYCLHHEILDGWCLWEDDEMGPPLLDLPGYEQSNYVLERRLATLVHTNEGRILLTGVGGDLYLRPQFELAADLLAHGRVGEAVGALARWATASRRSFWRLLLEHGVYPLLPARARYAFGKPALRVPVWVSADFSRRFQLRGRAGATRSYAGPWGEKARHLVTEALRSHASWVGRERIGEANLEWRHPFFHRPLVEYGLRLPAEWRVAPGANMSKRVLREAMRGILPEPVRLRRGKGALRPEVRSALRRQSSKLSRIVAKPVLAELGCLDPVRFAEAVTEPDSDQSGGAYLVTTALSLEFWVRRRLNRWS